MNCLSDKLRSDSITISLANFKSDMLDYYNYKYGLILNTYYTESPRTWNTVRVKCHTARSLCFSAIIVHVN